MQKSKIKIQNYNLKIKNKRLLERAVDFHGHLGPYLVLGMLMGDLAINKLKCKRHFGIRSVVRGALKKPKSCLIDGIQLSAGCTYGKGNITKAGGARIKVLFYNLLNNKKIGISFKENLVKRLDSLNGHKESEAFAKELLRNRPQHLFDLKF